MKYKKFHHPESMQPVEIDKDVWEMYLREEINGIQFIKETDADDDKLVEIFEWCHNNGMWAISDLVYFDNKEQEIEFFLKWA